MSSGSPAASRQFTKWQDRVTEPSLTALVLVELIAIFVAAPLTELGKWSIVADLLLLALIMGAGMLVVWRKRAAVIAIAAALVISFLTTPLRTYTASTIAIYVDF